MIRASARQLVLAAAFMTRLPMPRLDSVTSEEFAASMRWFPAAGLAVGTVVAGTAMVGALSDPWVGAVLGLAAWVLVTGGLHLDGLADLFDALGAAHRDQERFIAILSDPRIGSFGVLALFLQLAAKLVLLMLLVERGALATLPLLAMAARIGPLVWTRWLPPLKPGLGAGFGNAIGLPHILLWAIVLLVTCIVAPALGATVLLVPAWLLFLRRRVGGVSGDCHGAGIELVETCLLLALVATM